MRAPGNSSAASCSSRSTPGPTATKLPCACAFRALLGRRHRVAAVVADQPPPEAVIDQPGVAVRTGHAVAAGVAQGQRREAAAVEEQQRLLAALERKLDGLGEPRRDEAAARRPLALEIDRLDRRQMLPAEPLGQVQMRVAAALGVHHGFDRRRGRRQHDRNLALARTHHRHVAGVVAHAVLLLVGRVVLLIDDDEAEIGIGQEQSRARADHHRHLARRHRRPGARAPPRRDLGMPFRRPHAEALGEAVEELRGERDLRHQDQHLPAAPDDLGHRLEIDLGLARAGDAVDQRHREAALPGAGAQRVGRLALGVGELGRAMVGVGLARHRLRRQHQRLQRALVDQAVDHAGRDAGLARGLALLPDHAVGEELQHAGARRRHALRRRSRKPDADLLALGAEIAHAQAHAQHHAARRQRVARHPIDERAQLRLERRHVELGLDVFHAVVQAGLDRDVIGPDHADGLARAERHAHDVAGLQRKLARRPIRIGVIERHWHEDIDEGRGHAADVADSGRLRKGEGSRSMMA